MKMARTKDFIQMKITLALLLFIFPCVVSAQSSDSASTYSTKRRNILLIGGTTAYVGTMIGLNEVWYKNDHRESFHFFNDAHEWQQVDKVGHFFSAFQVSSLASHALMWTGVKKKKSMLAASITGLAVVSSIELFDGFSSSYGASLSDLVANTSGAALFYGQQIIWDEVRIYPKFSFHQTDFAFQRPNVLGNGIAQEIIKDYNGQTYWLSVDVDKFVKFPKWLNLAVGYGAQEMIYANTSSNRSLGLNPYRQYYLSLDLDLTSIKSKSKLVNALIYFANMVKIPAPSLEFSKKGVRMHAFYF
jgi:hypothetical protein